MKMKMTKDWFLKNIDREDKAIVSAGTFCVSQLQKKQQPVEHMTHSAFAMLVSLSRRKKGLTPEKLSDMARIDLDELVSIEKISGYVPEPRTVCQLALILNLPEDKLLQLSGNAKARDQWLQNQAVKFAARAQSMEKLNREEKSALEEFVKKLSESP